MDKKYLASLPKDHSWSDIYRDPGKGCCMAIRWRVWEGCKKHTNLLESFVVYFILIMITSYYSYLSMLIGSLSSLSHYETRTCHSDFVDSLVLVLSLSLYQE